MAFTWPTSMTDAAYSTAILQAVTQQEFDVTFAEVTSTIPGHTATFRVFSDALKVEGVRVGVSAYLAQQIADALGCMLLTPKLADLLYAQRAVTLTPWPFPVASTTAAMLKEDGLISAQLAEVGGAPAGQIVQTVGKHWVITNLLAAHPGMAINYGWHMPKGTASPWKGIPLYASVTATSLVIQQPSWAHGTGQFDESQNCVLVHRRCIVDGEDRDLLDVLKDKTLAPLASHEGVLQVFRQPGVPTFACPLPTTLGQGTTPEPAPCPTPPLPTYGAGPPPASSAGWGLLVAASILAVGGLATWLLLRRPVPGGWLFDNPFPNPARPRCYGPDASHIHHVPGCRPGRPLCRWRRRKRGICYCDAYHFPHRVDSGACRAGMPAALWRQHG